MGKLNRLAIYGFYVILCLTAEAFILWLFPYTGLAGLVCWPFTILLAFILGFAIYKALKSSLEPLQLSLLFVSIFTVQLILQLWTTPQEFGGPTFLKINDSFNAYINYNRISFQDFPKLSTQERVVFIYKFKKTLPNSFAILQIDSTGEDYKPVNRRTYVIENRQLKRYYDTTKLKIIENDSATFIIEHPYNSNPVVHKMNRNFLNIGAGGRGMNNLNINVKEDALKLDTGIEKALYTILQITRKPAGQS